MQTEQILCWSGMTDTDQSTTSRSNEVVVVNYPNKNFLTPEKSLSKQK